MDWFKKMAEVYPGIVKPPGDAVERAAFNNAEERFSRWVQKLPNDVRRKAISGELRLTGNEEPERRKVHLIPRKSRTAATDGQKPEQRPEWFDRPGRQRPLPQTGLRHTGSKKLGRNVDI